MNANITTYLNTLLENAEVKALIDKALSTYPMYKPTNEMMYTIIPTREELNKKLLNHYKYRQIGFETVGRFIDELEIAMNEIMPYYYQLFKSADIMNGIDDVFGNVDITESFTQETTGNTKNNSTENIKGNNESNSKTNASSSSSTDSDVVSKNKDVKSDTPQSKISDIGEGIGSSSIYASEVNFNESNTSSHAKNTGNDETTAEASNKSNQESKLDSNSESSGTVKHTLTKVGNQGVNTYAHDMKELRETFLNIEQMIIEDDKISELFLLVY